MTTMTETEIARDTNADSGQTFRIVETIGQYPGFRVQRLCDGPLAQSYWWQVAFVETLDAAHEEVRLNQLAAIELCSLTREHIPSTYPAPQTPSGPSDYAHRYADGLIKYNTPGHGYFWLSEGLNALVHPTWRTTDGFYEEDVCWAIVAHHFPEHFTTLDRRVARRTLIQWMPYEFMEVTGETVAVDESPVLQEAAFLEKHRQDWISISARNAPDEMVLVTATLGRSRSMSPAVRQERQFLVPADEYRDRSRYGFVIDLGQHREVPRDLALNAA